MGRWSTRFAYAVAALPLTVVQIPLYVYVPKFYTDTVGLPVAAVGSVLLFGRVLDAVTDPTIGWLSDRTRTRIGRRRPWILAGSIPLGLCIYLLFAPPAGIGVWGFAALLAATFLFWTIVYVPYEALGVELALDYDERTVLLGLRDGLALVGTLLAVLGPVTIAAVFGFAGDAAGVRNQMAVFGGMVAPAIVIGCALTGGLTREPVPKPSVQANWGAMWANRPFRILLASWVVGGLGANIPGATLLYFVDQVIEAPQPELFLVAYIVVGIVCTPGWLWLARKTEKRTAYMSALVLTSVMQGLSYFLGPGDLLLYGLITGASGVAFGAMLAMPAAMQGDVIDYGEHQTGRREEGLYIGVWSVCRKFAGAVGVGGALALLGWAGYEGTLETQPASAVWMIRIVYTVIPAAFTLAGAVLLWRYPLDRAMHAGLRQGISRGRETKAG